MLPIVTEVPPIFEKFTVTGLLVVLAAWVLKAMLVGETCTLV